MSAQPQATPAQIKAAFDYIDTDQSGQISVQEIQNLLDRLHITITPQNLALFLKQVDLNNSGAIEFNEFERLLEISRAQ